MFREDINLSTVPRREVGGAAAARLYEARLLGSALVLRCTGTVLSCKVRSCSGMLHCAGPGLGCCHDWRVVPYFLGTCSSPCHGVIEHPQGRQDPPAMDLAEADPPRAPLSSEFVQCGRQGSSLWPPGRPPTFQPVGWATSPPPHVMFWRCLSADSSRAWQAASMGHQTRGARVDVVAPEPLGLLIIS